MRHLYKIFHESSASDFEKVYQNRVQFDSSIHLGMNIKPMNQPHFYELYYIPSNNMMMMMNKLHMISREFNHTFNELPTVAQKQFVNECLVEELYNTNELEGIRSSREEIARSTKDILLNKKTNKRFQSMIKSYIRLLNNDIEFPKTPKDIRQIYDDITSGEIDQQELPDGQIFRKEMTYILKKSGTSKVVHQGITPETEIIRLIEDLLKFINHNDFIPYIIKVAVGHYYFGYVHPFYDGNGRTSRFISSIYLTKDLGNISTLSLSRGCNTFKNKYLEAFEITNSIRSRGEMNFFIETFLEIIIETLIQMDAELKEKNLLLNIALKKLKEEPLLHNMSENHIEIMWVLSQNHFFDSSSGLPIRDLAHILKKSEATVRKMIKELLEISLIEQKGERPAYFCITQRYFES